MALLCFQIGCVVELTSCRGKVRRRSYLADKSLSPPVTVGKKLEFCRPAVPSGGESASVSSPAVFPRHSDHWETVENHVLLKHTLGVGICCA